MSFAKDNVYSGAFAAEEVRKEWLKGEEIGFQWLQIFFWFQGKF